ncbi:LacI family DNA-binding transcriptional regulator [Paenibacillus sp. DMB20]|uniref:LacI family DNA-binding transcriptional regulator n=1 Tax=Paenibacillus sp. DMB20 TaxID=1642570 RepID=UPI000627B67C|nr:LacI family DNA-binding transcriptional regulator [Paenibacillus sp. DMB20]KKO53358.1 hypothetical protein XI25_13695 [Paenibacillus sp. DMB20]
MPTIYDIARLSGVSKSTVSRVLNHHPYVSEEKRQKVLKAVEELQFTQNARAVQFRLQQSNQVGIIVPTLDHPYFSQLVSALSLECNNHGLKTAVYQTFGNGKLEEEVYAHLRNKELDAVILASSIFSDREIAAYADEYPVVACNEDFPGDRFDVFCMDEEAAVFEATDFLLKSGKTGLIFCSDHLDHPSQRSRLRGFMRAHESRGLPCDGNYIFDGISSIEDGIGLGSKLFHSPDHPDGAIAGSDFVAAGLVKSASANNIKMPDEFAVFGFDNHPVSLVTEPQLSTISNSIEEMSRDLVRRLKNRIKGDRTEPFQKKVYKGKLIKRGSTAH